MSLPEHNLGELLLRQRKITKDELEEAVHRQSFWGENAKLGEILVEFGYCTRADIEKALFDQQNARNQPVDAQATADRLVEATLQDAEEHKAELARLREVTNVGQDGRGVCIPGWKLP